MVTTVISAIPYGFDGKLVEVEGDMNRGLPAFNIVGMANKTINEAKERTRSAILSSGFTFPDQKVTINLAPADLEKDGSHLDLPIALAILALSGQLLPSDLKNRLFVGELSLDGHLRPVKGIINIIETALQTGTNEVYLPIKNLPQARLIPGITTFGVDNLQELFLHLKQQKPLAKNPKNCAQPLPKTPANSSPLLDHVRGQSLAKRALEIAVAGHHNLLISGPPGAGKTLLAKVAANLLPAPTLEEQLATTKIYSLAGLKTDEIVATRPFRSPHHTASPISIIGGGKNATPSEISLAHKGILFLDEIPEFPRSVLEALRQPLEDKTISISRANQKSTYPADFMLIATMNPCPCGYLGDPTHQCTCHPSDIDRYQKKLSGPLFDRIDMNVVVEKVKNQDLLQPLSLSNHEHSVVKNNITSAIAHQFARYNHPGTYNSSLSSFAVAKLIPLDPKAQQLIKQASEQLNLSARAYFKTIKVARTIADLAGSAHVLPAHLAEALTFRHR